MCGIAGIIYKTQQVSEQKLRDACNILHHRGPDGKGIYTSNDGRAGLAHTRLSFLDLTDAGKQPMLSDDNTCIISYNGEVYNFRELRKELLSLGHTFHTETDTEVILKGYKEWGHKLPEKLFGMFAFAIYDEPNHKLFLCRDHFGIKPLFYALHPQFFAFGSEIKAIIALEPSIKKINPEGVSLFLANRYIPSPYTIWNNIFQLEAGNILEVDANTLQLHQHSFWNVAEKNLAFGFPTSFEQGIEDSLAHHLISDVKIGSFLSGGFDSSLLVYLMQQKLQYQTDAFTIGFSGWNESEHHYAGIVANKTGAKLYSQIEETIDLELVKKLMWHYDNPIADISILPTYGVSGLAAQHVKAVVSGEGADEFHAGYWWDKPENFHFSSSFKKWFSSISGIRFEHIKQHYVHAMSMGLFDNSELKKALNSHFFEAIPDDPFQHFDRYELKGSSLLKQIQYLNLHTFMSQLILTKVDRASMAHSLEVRVPFLYPPLMQYMFHLPENTYTSPGIQKPLIGNMLRHFFPSEIVERKKQGFVGPDAFYMNFDLYARTLQNGRLVSDGVVHLTYIRQLLTQKDHWRLWKFFVLENWWQVWM